MHPHSRTDRSNIGTRIHVTGSSCSGKTTLAGRLAAALEVPLVELDALNWLPDWVGLCEIDPRQFEGRIAEATAGDRWVVDGSYMTYSARVFWPRLDTVVWLDMGIGRLLYRVLKRSWRRWRHRELLWGTNYERFLPQLMLWRRKESLIWWIVTQYSRKRRDMHERMVDPRWSHVRFIRLTTPRRVEHFALSVERRISRGSPFQGQTF